MEQLELIHEPPPFCAYASGPCDQDFSALGRRRGLFLYASQPATIAATVESAVAKLQATTGDSWATWRDMDIPGHIVFCEICKSMRGSDGIYADVTTLNFNLLFEIGFGIGLGLRVRPIRDETYSVDKKDFAAIGVLDTLGYADFTNADNLVEAVLRENDASPVGELPKRTYRETPLYVLKGPIDTDGAVRLLSVIKKSRLGFRTHDPAETGRLPLHQARKQVAGSYGVVAHLLSPNRDGARAHNGLCAFVCGLATAQQKAVILLQEEHVEQPIDYRDLVRTYETPGQIDRLMEEPLAQVVEALQESPTAGVVTTHGILGDLDLGDTAAENEIRGLAQYFVSTGKFLQVAQGHAQLVVGRKGSGKTAMFYGLREHVRRGQQVLVLDMKPEGHQFTRLREAVLETLSEGQREYTIAAFWSYLLSAEVAHKILNSPAELRAAERDPIRHDAYKELESAYFAHGLASGDDLSQRLLRQIDRIAERFTEEGDVTSRSDLTELVYGGDIRTLNDAVARYVEREKEQIWLLIDNLDKSWATRGSTGEDMAVLRGLLDASQSLKRQFENRNVDLMPVVFVRTDIYQHLVQRTPDRGKDTVVNLDWEDPRLFREIVRARIEASTDLTGEFDGVWPQVGPHLVGIEDGFSYMLDRTLMRPRDLLMFIQTAIQVAIDRGNSTITAEDVKQAEASYSEDLLLNLSLEIDDTHPELAQAVYAFHGSAGTISKDAAYEHLVGAGVASAEAPAAFELLLWYAFLGVRMNATNEEQYSFGVRYNLLRLHHALEAAQASVVIHPAFRSALSIHA